MSGLDRGVALRIAAPNNRIHELGRPILLKQGWSPRHLTLYLRREVFDRWGLYGTWMDIAADYEAMLRYLVRGDLRLYS